MSALTPTADIERARTRASWHELEATLRTCNHGVTAALLQHNTTLFFYLRGGLCNDWKGLEKSIDAVIAAAERARVKLVWLGPPCVNKAWDKNARVAAVATVPHPAGSALVPRRRPLAG